MSHPTYWADELCMEAVLYLYGGPIRVLTANCENNVVTTSVRIHHGQEPNAVLQLGCTLDRHFYSFDDAAE
jgi:hypothetical protein